MFPYLLPCTLFILEMKQGSLVCLLYGRHKHQVVIHVVPGGWSDLLGWLRNRGLEVLSGFIHRRSGMSYIGKIFPLLVFREELVTGIKGIMIYP